MDNSAELLQIRHKQNPEIDKFHSSVKCQTIHGMGGEMNGIQKINIVCNSMIGNESLKFKWVE